MRCHVPGHKGPPRGAKEAATECDSFDPERKTYPSSENIHGRGIFPTFSGALWSSSYRRRHSSGLQHRALTLPGAGLGWDATCGWAPRIVCWLPADLVSGPVARRAPASSRASLRPNLTDIHDAGSRQYNARPTASFRRTTHRRRKKKTQANYFACPPTASPAPQIITRWRVCSGPFAFRPGRRVSRELENPVFSRRMVLGLFCRRSAGLFF